MLCFLESFLEAYVLAYSLSAAMEQDAIKFNPSVLHVYIICWDQKTQISQS